MERNVIVNKARYDIIPENKDIHKGKANMCIETGELFVSVKETHDRTGFPYATLIAHLNGKTKTCHGMHFCYISEMSYKANDIANFIIEMKQHSVSREDYVAVMMRNDKLETEKAMLQFKNRELQEELNSYKERFDRCYSALVG